MWAETVWTVDGEGFELNLLDAAVAGRARAAAALLRAGEACGDGPDRARDFCRRLRAYLDALLGDGVGARLLPGDDVGRAAQLATSLAAFGKTQCLTTARRATALLREYDPGEDPA